MGMVFTFNTELANIALQYARILNASLPSIRFGQELREHPHYPSLLSISDVFRKFGMENEAYKISREQFSDLEIDAPFVAHIKIKDFGNDFVLVTNINSNEISYIHKSGQPTRTTRQEFNKTIKSTIWRVTSPQNKLLKSGYKLEASKEQAKVKSEWLLVGLLVLLSSIMIYLGLPEPVNATIATILPIKLTGLVVTTLLFSFEINQNNILLKNICAINKKANCDAVLSSAGAKFWGTNWSEVGLTYFCASILIISLPKMDNEDKTIWLSIGSMASATFVPFSLYYQSRVVRQWCVMCLIIQLLLFLELLWSVNIWLTHSPVAFSFHDLPTILICLLLPFLFLKWFKPFLTKNYEYGLYRAAYRRLQYNEDIFNSLLTNQPKIPDGWQNLGIDLGHNEAKNTIIKICNPYCGPCNKAHQELKKLMSGNTSVKVKIIYISRNLDNSPAATVIKHILSLQRQGDMSKLESALNLWYDENFKKDYKRFSEAFPATTGYEREEDKIDAMAHWCNVANVTHTPTIFINGYRLPENYNIEELNHVL